MRSRNSFKFFHKNSVGTSSIFKVAVLCLLPSLNSYSQRVKEYNDCAVEMLNKKDSLAAIAYFSRVIEINPNDSFAYFDRGFIKDNLKNYAGAIDDYTKQIAIDSASVDSYFLRGIARIKVKNYTDARIDFDKVIEMEPTNVDAYYYRCKAKMELGLNEGGALDFKKYKELGGEN